MFEASGAYARLLDELRELATLRSAASVLSWDQETMLPTAGTALRAEQLSLLSGIVHERWVDPRIGDLIAEAAGQPEVAGDARESANLRELRRDYDRSVRLPQSLVRETTHTATLAQGSWREARRRSDFASFAPHLERVFELARARGDCLSEGTDETRYEALMDGYEPATREATVDVVFASLREALTPIIHEAAEREQPADPLGALRLPVDRQAAFNRMIAERMGFSFEAGRLDDSTHPFCEGIGPGDTRLTTRYAEDAFLDALTSTMHEAGHGLYEQGLPKADRPGQPLGEAVSLGIHESQSRLWENMVGRSLPFWRWALPLAKAHFGEPLQHMDAEAVVQGVNRIQPTLIRVESDEATYNLHIMLRFDLERAMLSGDLPIDDLPAAWNERIRTDLGLEVPDDRRGCLQDIHWSMGAIGYFPTYTLGNLYAAQLWSAARGALPDLDEGIARGEMRPLLDWLRENVHRHGRQFPALDLCRRVTGRALDHQPFVGYIEEKSANRA